MGTETAFDLVIDEVLYSPKVKLNNPLMGTETHT